MQAFFRLSPPEPSAGAGGKSSAEAGPGRSGLGKFWDFSLFHAGGVALTIVVAALLLIWGMLTWADRSMREELLQQTRLVARTLNARPLQTLGGSRKDLANPVYLRLREQLEAVRQTAGARFVYLMGRRLDPEQKNKPEIFFFADAQSANGDSSLLSLPGDPYDEASPELIAVFDQGDGLVEGPLPDAWGVWVSALVPVINPADGKPLAVLGMDVDASDWNIRVAARIALPIGMMVLMLIGAVTLLAILQKRNAGDKPVLRTLMPPLTAMVVLILLGGFALLWWQHRSDMNERINEARENINTAFREDLKTEAVEMSKCLDAIATDPRTIAALKADDAAKLQKGWHNAYLKMRDALNVRHLDFFDRNRICLLRMDAPELHGDKADLFILCEAERTGKAVSGIEIGRTGAISLRSVQPVFDDGKIIGYVGIGKSVESVLSREHLRGNTEIAVLVHKKNLDRAQYEKEMRQLGRPSEWDRMPDSVAVYSSRGTLPKPFLAIANHNPANGHSDNEGHDINLDGKEWRFVAGPIVDAGGKSIGCLLVMSDITPQKSAFMRMLLLGGVGG
ncbi:MAG: cache domain-containing protein, partial [Victivallaceae bacterium]